MNRSWFPSSYLSPEALHDVWFQLDEPILVVFTGSSSQLSKDFCRKLEGVVETLTYSIGVKCVAIDVAPENELELIKDWKINRYPTVLVYDGSETVRLTEDISPESLTAWIRSNIVTT